MHWPLERVSEERPFLQALADYKYDEYQQFSAGTRFVESLALWIRQFDAMEEREAAYDFIKTKLVFLSSAEMQHFVQMAYPDHIRPHLLRRAAAAAGHDPHHPARVAASTKFRALQRKSLFLGLSDGARIDLFRRSNPDLSHEQILQTYDLAPDRVDELLTRLRDDLSAILARKEARARFSTLVLLDDFSASGRSYYMPKQDAPLGGKLAKFYGRLTNPDDALSTLVALSEVDVIIVIYAATTLARQHILDCSRELWGQRQISCQIEIVQQLPDSLRLTRGNCGALQPLVDHYYDHDVYDSHMAKGGTPDARYGFADCGLPLVLHHNTPNNSIALLWSYEDMRVRGLFPRVRRHKEPE